MSPNPRMMNVGTRGVQLQLQAVYISYLCPLCTDALSAQGPKHDGEVLILFLSIDIVCEHMRVPRPSVDIVIKQVSRATVSTARGVTHMGGRIYFREQRL